MSETVPDGRRHPDGGRYAAFISYSHAEDAAVARHLRQALEGFGRGWFQSRRFRVWHDTASLAMTADLWPELQRALDRSDHLLVLLSPAVARSPWVERELRHFLERHPPQAVGFIVTSGPMPWVESPALGAVNPYERLLTSFASTLPGAEPLVVDLRPFAPALRASGKLPARALEHVAAIAARLEGTNKDEVYGQHLRGLRRRLLIARGAVIALVGLLLATGTQMLRERVFKQDERGVQAAFLAARSGREVEALSQSILAVTWGLEHPISTALAQPDQVIADLVECWLKAGPARAPSARVRPALMQGLIASTQAALRGRRIARVRGLWNADLSRDGTELLVAGRFGVEVRGADGARHWRTPESVEASWATFAGDRVVLITPDGLQAWRAGNLLWSSTVDAQRHGGRRVLASGDGRHVLSVARHELQLRDAATGALEEAYPRPSPSEGIDAAALSRDAGVVAFATSSSIVVVHRRPDSEGLPWTERATSEQTDVHSLSAWADVHSLALSADGSKLASGHRDGTIAIWLPARVGPRDAPLERAVGALPPSRHTEWVGCLDFSADGRWLVSGSADGSAWVWDLERVRPVSALRGHSAFLRSVRFSRDGQGVLTSSEDDAVRVHPLFPEDRVLDLQPNAPGRFGTGGSSETPPLRVRVSRDGSQAAILDGLRRLWSWPLGRGQPAAVTVGHDVLDFAFGADNRLIVLDTRGSTAPVSMSRSRRTTGRGRDKGWLSPHGERAVTLDRTGKAVLIDPRTGVVSSSLEPQPSEIRSASFSDDADTLVLYTDDAVDVFDARTGRRMRRLRDNDRRGRFVQVSADGRSVLARGKDGAVELWSPWSDTARALTLIAAGERREQRATWAPDSKRLALADETGTLSLATLDGASTVILDRNLVGEADFEFSSDGRMLAASASAAVTLWDLAFEALVGRFQLGEAELATTVRDMSLSADASKLVVLGFDGRAYLFNTDLASALADACRLLPEDPEFGEALAACRQWAPGRPAALFD